MSRVIAILLALGVAAIVVVQYRSAQRALATRQEIDQQLTEERALHQQLRDKMALLEQETGRLRSDAAEVHRLRAEISSLRAENHKMTEELARTRSAAAAATIITPSEPAESRPFTAPVFSSYEEMGKFVADLRAKAFGSANGQLTLQERQYLESLKPELEKLEKSPAEFAAFQAELIQNAAGITDPEKKENIRQLVQRVYESAVARGLDVLSRPAEDPAWVQERFQLDRRGTSAVQRMLTDQERAAFDQRFLGIMGVDLGTGVDRSLYPPGFLQEGR